MDQHESQISAPDRTRKLRSEALPPAVVTGDRIPASSGEQAGSISERKRSARERRAWSGSSLVWRGLNVLGAAIGIAGVWYVAAWIRYGRQPLADTYGYRFGTRVPEIVPPDWLLAIIGLLVCVAIVLMLIGTRNLSRGK